MMLLKRVLVIAFVGACWAGGSFGQTPPSGFLPEEQLPQLKALISESLAQSPTSLNASLEVAKAEALRQVERSVLLPSVNADGRWGAVQSSVAGGQSNRNVGFFYSANVSQPVFHWGALRAQAEIGALGEKIAQDRLDDAYRSLALSVRAQYLDLIQRKKGFALAVFNVDQAKTSLANLEDRHRSGMISSGELVEPRLRLEELELAADRSREFLDSGCRILAALCGRVILTHDEIADEFPRPELNRERLDILFGFSSRFNPLETPQGQILQASLEQTELNYRIIRSRTLPKFNVSLRLSQDNNTDAAGGSVNQTNVTQQTLAIGGNWLLFDGFATRANKAANRYQRRQQEQALADYDLATRNRLESLRKQIELAHRALMIAEKRLAMVEGGIQGTQNEIKIGRATNDMLVTAKFNAKVAELSTLMARSELLNRIAEYLSLIGADPATSQLPRISRYGK